MAEPSTINFTPIADASYFNLAALNDLFAEVARVINKKLDAGVPQDSLKIVVGEDPVAVNTDTVVFRFGNTTELAGLTYFNFQRLVNLKPGTDPGDAITVGQAKQLLGVA